MPIHVIHYRQSGTSRWGIARDGSILPIPGTFDSTGDFITYAAGHMKALSELETTPIDSSAVEVLSPITRNQQLICLGANYRSHMIESGIDPDSKSFNMVFRKASSSIVPASSDIVRPRHVALLDYEIELGLVVKRDISGPLRVGKDELHRWVAGVTIVNDVSARDVQIPEMQFYKGKSYRTFAPVGPRLCLLDEGELGYLDDLRLTLSVNDEVRQSASTTELVHSPEETLAELSGIQDLHPGDLIATGTPAGCALRVPKPAIQKLTALLPDATRWRLFHEMQRKRRQYLQPSDVIESTITSADGRVDLGTQRNRVTVPAS